MSGDSQVSVREEVIELTTYLVGSEDRNPPIDRDPRWWVYPYAMQDFILGVKTVRRYKAVVLENEYLRLVVLPELGGRLYKVIDKTTGEEFFYCNHVVKPARVGLRGAWLSGGVEFNFPNGHTVTTVSPILYRVERYPDGGASITVGDHEYVSRMSWSVTLTLRPGRAYIEEHVRLFNHTPLPQRYWFWSNSAVHATPGLRFITPARRALTSLGIIPYPFYKRRDYSWYRVWEHASDTFSLEADEDFFGWYLYDLDRGGVHVARRYEVEGKKLFTWGTADSGMIWVDHLTDFDEQYCEIQSGRFLTQFEYEFMEPHFLEEWVEYWYPIHGTGGFVYATRDATLNLETSDRVIRVVLYPTRSFRNAVLRVDVEGVGGWECRINLEPGRPRAEVFQSTEELGSRTVRVSLRSEDGVEVLSYVKRPGEPRESEAVKPKHMPDPTGTAEELYFKGLYMAKKGFEEEALKFFDKALEKDPGFSQAKVDRAVVFIKRGLFDLAVKDLGEAVDRILTAERERGFVSKLNRYPGLDRAYYYLGLAYRLMGRLEEARECFWRLITSRGYASLGFYFLGELALLEGRLGEALPMLQRALRLNPIDVKAKTLAAAVLRRLGRPEEAVRLIREALEDEPLGLMANFELMLAYEAQGLSSKTEETRRRVENLLYRPRNPIFTDGSTPPYYSLGHYLELGVQYEEVGLYEEAVRVFSMSLDKPARYPLIMYHLAYCLDRLGKTGEASEVLEKAAGMSVEYVFPYHLETVKVLEWALELNPRDANAMYLLGLLLYAKGRRDEAMEWWRGSLEAKPNNSLAHRNLGLAYWRYKRDYKKALSHYREALRLDPGNSRLYVEFDRLCEEAFPDLAEERVKVLESAPEEVLKDDYVVECLARAYAATGRLLDAYKVLTSHKFYPWEGATATRKLYRDVCVKLGSKALENGKPEKAVKFLKAALEFPRNIGVGRPPGYIDREALKLLARAYEALGDLESARRIRESITGS